MTVKVKTFSKRAEIDIDLSDVKGIEFNGKTYRFTCCCGKALQLQRVLIDKLSHQKSVALLQHIVNTTIKPWLDEHQECGSPTISMPV